MCKADTIKHRCSAMLQSALNDCKRGSDNDVSAPDRRHTVHSRQISGICLGLRMCRLSYRLYFQGQRWQRCSSVYMDHKSGHGGTYDTMTGGGFVYTCMNEWQDMSCPLLSPFISCICKLICSSKLNTICVMDTMTQATALLEVWCQSADRL